MMTPSIEYDSSVRDPEREEKKRKQSNFNSEDIRVRFEIFLWLVLFLPLSPSLSGPNINSVIKRFFKFLDGRRILIKEMIWI